MPLGVGDNWHMSWAADGRLFVALCDGLGFSDNPQAKYNSRLFSVEGGPTDPSFHEVPGYPDLAPPQSANIPRYYGFGTLAIDGSIYQFLSTWNHRIFTAEGQVVPGLRFVGAKLIFSRDNGKTWRNQDGTTPVRWEDWQLRSRQTMVFFEESQETFSMISLLQMGRNYEHNRDGYVYAYSPNGNTDGAMNELAAFRVPKTRILERAAYEYFAGFSAAEPRWSTDIHARVPIHTFPRGWVNQSVHPWAWMPSVVYNAPLGLYMMTSWGSGNAPDGKWFGKPSYLGFWTAVNPWGPWTQVHEELEWMPNRDPKARSFAPQICPKWIAEDGKSFWLVWSDYRGELPAQINVIQRRGIQTLEEARTVQQAYREHKGYYAFNAQRVDLVVA